MGGGGREVGVKEEMGDKEGAEDLRQEACES